MWLLSSWTNFLVTASSIICFTCQSQRQMLYDSFINVPQLFMNNSHTHTQSPRGGGLLVTVWLSAKKYILENNSCKRGKWWEGSALRFWKVKRRKKKSRVHAELEDESPALIPRTSTGKNGNVTCEFVWGWGGDLREGRRTDPLFWTLYKPRGEQLIQLRQRLMMTSYLSEPNFKEKIRRTCSQGNVQCSPSRWPENSYRATVRRLINQSLRWLWRRALLCNLHGEY